MTVTVFALEAQADIYVINRENVLWLVEYYGKCWPFDMVIVDELSSFKGHRALRFKALKSVLPYIKRIVGLTATPAPNGLLDLWPQIYLLDQGERLGRYVTHYREKYFVPGKVNRQTGAVYSWSLKPASAGHGLNLQAGGHTVVWFGLPWSLELYEQGNGRIHRQGQDKPVIVYHLVAGGTIDEDVIAALEGKAVGQSALLAAVRARIAAA